MRRVLPLALVFVVLNVVPAGTWGFDVHRFVTAEAIALLPDALRPFYEGQRAFVVEHSVDPDLWRTAGFADEPPRHFLDLDAYGSYPFMPLPRDLDEAIRRFGRPVVTRNGLLPWRTEEMWDRLRKAFTQSRTRPAFDDIAFLSAVVSHYAADAFVPFHAVLNYDGQLTNQTGIHARFETALFERYRSRLTLRPRAARPVTDARTAAFDALIAGSLDVEPILRADREAVAGDGSYGDRYFAEFRSKTQPILERRLAESMTAVASLITGAWERAGRPSLGAISRRPRPRSRASDRAIGHVAGGSSWERLIETTGRRRRRSF